jgi:hypothetical protein
MFGIARKPWTQPKELFALFDEAYPQPKDGSRRKAPFVPYLAYVPDDFVLSLCFAGGGVFSAGRLMFDAEGNLWSGQNWMAGSQSVSTKVSMGAWSNSPRMEHRSRHRSPALPGRALMESVGAPP